LSHGARVYPEILEVPGRISHSVAGAEAEHLNDLLARIPDLTETLREAPVEVKRQTFEAFDLRIQFDKAERRIEVSATISEAVVQAFEKTEALQGEGFHVTVSDIALTGWYSNQERADAIGRLVRRLGSKADGA